MEGNTRPGDLKDLAFLVFFSLRFAWELGFRGWDLISNHGVPF
jgi:hypothetical protein